MENGKWRMEGQSSHRQGGPPSFAQGGQSGGNDKKEVPGGISQPDTSYQQSQYSRLMEKCQAEAWTPGDASLRARHLEYKKWSGAPNLSKYWVDVNHPDIKPIYQRFCFLVTGRRQYPISDTQRYAFDRMVLAILVLKDKTKEEKIRLLEWDVERIPESPYWVAVPWVPSGRHLEHERYLE